MSEAIRKANYNVGKWLSAALEDPAVCAEMKADIEAWFEAHTEPWPDAPAQGSGSCGAELFCDWLRGYFAGLAGKDELTAREANQIRNTLNSLAPSSIPSTNRVCVRCGCETRGEEAFVNDGIWCHPCADGCSFSSTNGDTP